MTTGILYTVHSTLILLINVIITLIIIVIKNQNNIWKFDGSLSPDSNGATVPPTLYNFIKWILDGPRNDINLSEEHTNVLHRTAANISQTIMYEVKSTR